MSHIIHVRVKDGPRPMHSYAWHEGYPTVSCYQHANGWHEPDYPFELMLAVLSAAFRRGNRVTVDVVETRP